MTLILTAIIPGHVVQVSDRLVTTTHKAVVDQRANKVLLYRADDAIAVLGYTGLAFLGDRPTDEWIAERLWGEPLVVVDGSAMAITTQRESSQPRELGPALKSLRDDLQAFVRRLSIPEQNAPLQINVAGWRSGRRWIKPVFFSIQKQPGSSSHLSFDWLTHSRFRQNSHILTDTGGWLGRSGGGQLLHVLSKCADADSAINTLADAIRAISRSNKQVGPDLMAIHLPAREQDPCRVRFLPSQIHVVPDRDGQTVPVYFTPWIAGLTMLFGPSATRAKDFKVTTGGRTIAIDSPEDGMSSSLVLHAQKRPEKPK